MRRILGFAALLLAMCVAPSLAQVPKPPAGMDTYLFGVLRRGEVKPTPPDQARTLQAEHRANMQRMADEGVLVGAGPLIDAGDYRGIFIFKVGPRARIDELLKGDPLIQSGRLVLELLPWWGPEKIGEGYVAAKRANPGAEDRMVTYQLAFLFSGPNRKSGEDPETRRIQEGHMAHIRKMAEAGQMVAAGPFVDDNKLRGVFVFKMPSLDAAKAIAEQDPAVRAGRLVVEIHPWLVADGVLPAPTSAGPAK